jgi:hypothetical protein
MTFSEDSEIEKFDSEIQNLIDDCHRVQRNIDELRNKVSNISFEYNNKPNLFSRVRFDSNPHVGSMPFYPLVRAAARQRRSISGEGIKE